MYKKIKIYAPPTELSLIKININQHKDELNKRNITVNFEENPKFFVELYGKDGGLKKTIHSAADIPSLVSDIQNNKESFTSYNNYSNYNPNNWEHYINQSIEPFANVDDLLNKCNLPKNQSTSHCFNDSTHHTCCMLGPKARKYADNSGNPIGITSENAFYHRYGKRPQSEELTPWCTCTGSKVCSYYKNKFNDGTHIKFIGSLDMRDEDEAINKMNIERHSTPGII